MDRDTLIRPTWNSRQPENRLELAEKVLFIAGGFCTDCTYLRQGIPLIYMPNLHIENSAAIFLEIHQCWRRLSET